MPSGLSESLGTSLGPLASYALAAVVVLALILLVLFIAKRASGARGGGLNAKRGPRLAVVDVAAVDQRRKLVLVRRDEIEHLVLIGGQNDLLVEGNILRTPAPLRQPANEWPGAIEMNGSQQSLAPTISPEPRKPALAATPARNSSPLRRQIPAPEPRIERNAAQVSSGVAANAMPDPTPQIQPAPTLEPAIVAEAVASPRQEPRPAANVEVRQQAPVQQGGGFMGPSTSPVAAPPPSGERVNESVSPSARAPNSSGGQPPIAQGRTPEENKVPSFLRRAEGAPAVNPVGAEAAAKQNEPAVARPSPSVAVSPSRRTPDFMEAPARPAPVVSNKQPTPPPSPFIDALPVPENRPAPSASFVDPVTAGDRPTRFVEDQAPTSSEGAAETRSDAPRPATIDTLGNNEAERKPLSVRSFATVIQSRRQNVEPSRISGTNDQQPNGGAQKIAPAVDRSSQSRVPPDAAASAANDSALDDLLTRELDSDIGSLDWAGAHHSSETGRTSAPAVDPAAGAGKPPERQLTLEEEMERLLGDFDMNDGRR